MSNIPEPWLRRTLPDVNPLLMPVLHALMQAREDLRRHSDGLNDQQVWIRPHGLTPLGFHLRHIAGSLDRLTSYLEDRRLHDDQLAFLGAESTPGASLYKLLDDIDTAIDDTSEVIRSLDVTKLTDARTVGRKELPTTVIGLAVHIAEHTQRHVGQAITTCALLKRQ
jgi:hypothetical protein